MADGRHRVLDYGVSRRRGLRRGPRLRRPIRVLVEPVGGTLPEDLLADLVARRGAGGGGGAGGRRRAAGPRVSSAPPAMEERLREDRSGFEPDGATFVTLHAPPLRLVVVGGVHIAQALVPMARLAGYAVTVIDPRDAFASAARFPDTALVHDWPDAAMEAFAPDARTAVVLLTHDPKLDDPALRVALDSAAFYIGALGSTRTHAEAGGPADGGRRRRRRRSTASTRPSGLDIGARTPGEIAVAVLAAMTRALRRP